MVSRTAHFKSNVLAAGKYPSSSRPKYAMPLLELLQESREPFKSLYGEPPTAEDGKNAKDLPNISNVSQLLCIVRFSRHPFGSLTR